MTFRVNARKSHSERRETLGAPPCLDWFSSASPRAPVRSLLLFFFLSSFFPSFLSLSLSTFTLLLFLLPPANVLPGSRPRYTFLPPRGAPFLSSFSQRRSFYSRLLLPSRFYTSLFFLFFSPVYASDVYFSFTRSLSFSLCLFLVPPLSSPFSRVSHTVIFLAFLF